MCMGEHGGTVSLHELYQVTISASRFRLRDQRLVPCSNKVGSSLMLSSTLDSAELVILLPRAQLLSFTNGFPEKNPLSLACLGSCELLIHQSCIHDLCQSGNHMTQKKHPTKWHFQFSFATNHVTEPIWIIHGFAFANTTLTSTWIEYNGLLTNFIRCCKAEGNNTKREKRTPSSNKCLRTNMSILAVIRDSSNNCQQASCGICNTAPCQGTEYVVSTSNTKRPKLQGKLQSNKDLSCWQPYFARWWSQRDHWTLVGFHRWNETITYLPHEAVAEDSKR